MDDNTGPHSTPDVQELLENNDIAWMDWPAYSPDLNSIEHVWDSMGRRLAARGYPPESIHKLKQVMVEKSALVLQELFDNLMLSIILKVAIT